MTRYVSATATLYFGFGLNSPADGSASDAGSTPTAFVRTQGATASDAPITTGVSVALLSNASFPAGCYEVTVNGTTASLVADTAYDVYVSATIGAITSVAKIGTFVTTELMDAAGVRTAVGLATANLDTQLGNVPTVSEFEARSILAADYALEASLDAIDDVLAEAISGVTPFSVNVSQISGDTVAADNLESYTDGTAQLPVDVQEINSAEVAGTGTAGDLWTGVP